jgi:hypothetical protein
MSNKLLLSQEFTIYLTPFDEVAHELAKQAEESGQTIVHCSYVSKHKYIFGGWVNIWPTTYLVDENDSVHLPLLHAERVPLAPQKHYFQEPGQLLSFTLHFPGIPKNWNQFSFKEIVSGGKKGFEVKTIYRNNVGVYHIELK